MDGNDGRMLLGGRKAQKARKQLKKEMHSRGRAGTEDEGVVDSKTESRLVAVVGLSVCVCVLFSYLACLFGLLDFVLALSWLLSVRFSFLDL